MIWELYIGRRNTGITVRPDPEWAGMWRVHHGDRVSDMVNLTRAKDAAISWADLPSGGYTKMVKWKRAISGAVAPPVSQMDEAYVQ